MIGLHKLPVKAGDVILVPGDLHFGICDLAAFNLMVEAAEDFGVTGVVLLGDTFEAGGLSSHSKAAKKQVDGSLLITREIEQAKEPLETLLAMARKGMAVAMPGNHEERVNRFVDENPAWLGMEWDDVFAPALKGWATLESDTFVKAGPLTIHHGHRLAGMKMGGGVTPAKTVLSKYPGQNSMFGHTHRRDVYTRPTWKDGVKIAHGAWNVGHMQDERAARDWMPDAAWEQSFALVSYHAGRGGELLFDVGLARYVRDRRNRPTCMVNGRSYA